jgi:rhamnosyl/mannosyltransferase
VTHELVSGLNRRGIQADVLCSNIEAKTVREVGSAGEVIIRSARIARVLSTSVAPAMIRHLYDVGNRYDAIHVHLPDPMANLAIGIARPRPELIVHWHNDIVRQKNALRLYGPMQSRLLRQASAIVATSAAYAASSASLRPFERKLVVIPIGISDPADGFNAAIESAALAVRQRLGARRIVFALGRLTHYKGFDVLIRAATRLPADMHVVIGGGGESSADLAALARELGVAERIHLVGPLDREQVAVHHRAADIFCLPSTSRAESFGVVLLEAMAASRPVVATDIAGSGVPWINAHGSTGLNVPVGDPTALADALNCLARDDALRDRMGRAAHERYLAHFTADRMVDATAGLYRRLLQARQHHGSGRQSMDPR